jgi:uncharacterized protein YfaP (DUF2135 family)
MTNQTYNAQNGKYSVTFYVVWSWDITEFDIQLISAELNSANWSWHGQNLPDYNRKGNIRK